MITTRQQYNQKEFVWVLHSKNFICCDKRVIHVNFFQPAKGNKNATLSHKPFRYCDPGEGERAGRGLCGGWWKMKAKWIEKESGTNKSAQQKKSQRYYIFRWIRGGGEEEKGIETDSIWHFSNNMWIVFKKQKCLLEFGSATTVPASKEQKLHWQRVEVGEFSRCEHPGISQNGLTFFVHDKNISIVQIGDTFYFLHWCFVPRRDSNNKTGKKFSQ